MTEKEFKGLIGESLTKRLIEDNIRCYHQLLKDVVINYNDKKTQIDNILITSKGIYVIENKNHSGVIIFNKDNCIQYLGEQHKEINNPITQNNYHIDILSKVLNISIDNIKSYIVMGYETKINNKTDENIVNIQDLIPSIIKDMYNSNDIYTHEEIDNMYLKLLMINMKEPINI